ncbi:putative ribonuclease H protein [Trifolium medium]|uniref:Putative ribonuclease H protein n=1 Tax=Trifolium medium TaxID=97028 RepID=A0A392MA88_9FABA|nr:putative ribonuclease H protein [Trifolium medium]
MCSIQYGWPDVTCRRGLVKKQCCRTCRYRAEFAASAGQVRLVLWRTPVIGWMEENTDGSVLNVSPASEGLFRDYMANFHGGVAQKIDSLSVLYVEIMALIIAMGLAHRLIARAGITFGWRVI